MPGNLALTLPMFLYPVGFALLAAIPVLVAIYLLHNKSRRHVVSSLMLWMDHSEMREGGLKVRRLQTPLLFLLELVALLLFTIAAAGPIVQGGQSGRPLVVVLDNSFSMLARDGRPRQLAIAAIEQELRRAHYQPVRLIVAEEEPTLLGEGTDTPGETRRQLARWSCQAGAADLPKAIAFAYEIGGSRASVLVVTDSAPSAPVQPGRLEWWAFGEKADNVAVVSATRDGHGHDRCLVEVANLATQPVSTWLTVEQQAQPPVSERIALHLKENEVKRMIFEAKAAGAIVHARLDKDNLAIDNEALLLPAAHKLVRTDIRVVNPVLRQLCEKALAASGLCQIAHRQPEMVVCDQATTAVDSNETWLCEFVSAPQPTPYIGPFVFDRNHPLSEGVILDGVVWGSGKTGEMPGIPVLMAGNVTLLSDNEYATGRHHVRISFAVDFSTLHNTPNWPILMWNLVQWRAANLPGLREQNVRLGGEVHCTLPAGTAHIRLQLPDGSWQQRQTPGKNWAIKADSNGVYEIKAGEASYRFAVNALNSAESDLRQATTGRWGNWAVAHARQWETYHAGWLFLLLALVCLSFHLWMVHRAGHDIRY